MSAHDPRDARSGRSERPEDSRASAAASTTASTAASTSAQRRFSSTIRIATRASRLARWQTDWVARRLRETTPGLDVEIVEVSTTGDRVRDRALASIGLTGVFTKELEELLLAGEADIAVHSLKDVETTLPDGLALLALPAREDPRDALVCREAAGLVALPDGALIGTSSLRRRAQLAAWRADLRFVDLRGNVPTRLDKLARGVDGIDATLLASAGLTRLGHADRITEVIDPDVLVPAVGQGALAIEGRQDDARVRGILRPLDVARVRAETDAERTWLRRLHGGCQVPAGALARVTGEMIELRAVVCALDGSTVIRDHERGAAAEAVAIGERLAERMLARGAAAIVAAVEAELRGATAAAREARAAGDQEPGERR